MIEITIKVSGSNFTPERSRQDQGEPVKIDRVLCIRQNDDVMYGPGVDKQKDLAIEIYRFVRGKLGEAF